MISEFLSAVRNISWWRIYSCEDVNCAVEMLSDEITKFLDKQAPVKVFQVRTNYAPWLSKSTKDLMSKRDAAQKKASETNVTEDWKLYKSLRNRINNILKSEKKNYQTRKLKEATGDISKTWKSVKSWLGWTSGGPPTQLVENGLLVNKPSALAECMNSYFTSKVRGLRENLPPNQLNPLSLVENLMKNRTCSFSLKPVHPDEIEKIISSLKSTNSCGLDNIDSYVIKLAKSELIPVITHIVNLSISQHTFPLAWKTAKIIPLHKKDELTAAQNYRPVALLSIFSKILERAVFLQIIDYMENNDLLHPSHHGFRRHHSTATALLEMYNVWLEAFDQDKLTAVVMVDLSAAFDVVDPGILVEKLRIYGFQDNAVDWIQSYLTNRNQRVYVDGALSDPQEVNIGVPQGSILGPLLYTIYTNDLPESVHNHDPVHPHPQVTSTAYNVDCKPCGSICCFADDSTFSVSDKDPNVLQDSINSKFKIIADYMAMNKLFLNSDKTHLLIMTSEYHHKRSGNFGIKLDTGSELISPSDNERLLGAQVSNNFTWNAHINGTEKSMCKQLTSRVNALSKISWSADFQTRKMVANALVMSRLVYVIQLYGNAKDYLLKSLQVLQNKAARTVTRSGWRTETSVLLRQIGWLSVKQLVVYHSLLLVFKINRDGKPGYLSEKLKKDFSYRTRQATGNCLVVQGTPDSDNTKTAFVHRTTIMWNNLPLNVRKIQVFLKFKHEVKNWVMRNIEI